MSANSQSSGTEGNSMTSEATASQQPQPEQPPTPNTEVTNNTTSTSAESSDGNNNEANDSNNNVGAATSTALATVPSSTGSSQHSVAMTSTETTLSVIRPPALPPRPPNLVLPHAGAVPRGLQAPQTILPTSKHYFLSKILGS